MAWSGAAALIADVDVRQRESMTRTVHEAMLTMRMLTDRERSARGRSCWPDYVYEREDYGDRPALEELRSLSPPWRPTARHIDDMDWVFIDCYGQWMNPRTKKNGLERWQWILLELRAWQCVFNWKGGWRHIASSFELRPGMPNFSREWCRVEHDRLIDVALIRAREMGRV